MTPQKVEEEKAAGHEVQRSMLPSELYLSNARAARVIGDLLRTNPDAPLGNLANVDTLCGLYGYPDVEGILHKAIHTIPAIRALQYEKSKAESEKENNSENYLEMRMRGVTVNG